MTSLPPTNYYFFSLENTLILSISFSMYRMKVSLLPLLTAIINLLKTL